MHWWRPVFLRISESWIQSHQQGLQGLAGGKNTVYTKCLGPHKLGTKIHEEAKKGLSSQEVKLTSLAESRLPQERRPRDRCDAPLLHLVCMDLQRHCEQLNKVRGTERFSLSLSLLEMSELHFHWEFTSIFEPRIRCKSYSDSDMTLKRIFLSLFVPNLEKRNLNLKGNFATLAQFADTSNYFWLQNKWYCCQNRDFVRTGTMFKPQRGCFCHPETNERQNEDVFGTKTELCPKRKFQHLAEWAIFSHGEMLLHNYDAKWCWFWACQVYF